MATYKAVLSQYKKTDGTHAILIRVTKGRKIAYIPVDHFVKAKDWNEGRSEVRASHPMHAVYNNDIKKIIRNAETEESKALQADQDIDSKTIRKKVKKTPGKVSFQTMATEYINALGVAKRSKERYHTHLAMFTKIVGDLTPQEITKSVIVDYESQQMGKKSENTIHRGIGTLSGIYRDLQESGDILPGKNPFKYSSAKQRRKEVVRLTIEEIEALTNAKGSVPEELAKDVFLLQYFLGGLRISDVLLMKIKNIHKDRILYSDMKTNKPQSHIIFPKAMVIISKHLEGKISDSYLIPLMTKEEDSEGFHEEIEAKTSYVNKYLKKIAKKAKITTTISSHIARHTFADHLRKSGSDLYAISKSLGHSSLKMTENYMESFDTESIDKAMKDLFKTI